MLESEGPLHYFGKPPGRRGIGTGAIPQERSDEDGEPAVRIATGPYSPGWGPVLCGLTMQRTYKCSPDIGTQVLLVFPWGTTQNPVVLGSIHDEKHLPPELTTENPSENLVYQTKKHRLEFVDESGKESVTIHTAKGKMRLVLSCEKGIELTNELGDITIECKNLTMESEKDTIIQASKKLTITGEDAIATKSMSHPMIYFRNYPV